MPSDGLCFVCHSTIAANDESMRSVEFVGDAQHEYGRYAVHGSCGIGLRHQWLTRSADGQLVPLTPKNAPGRKAWYHRVLSRFFAWGAAKFQGQRTFLS